MTDTENHRNWKVEFSSKVTKQLKKMPGMVLDALTLLANDIEDCGPIQKNWPNFGALRRSRNIPCDSYHCHVKKGRPTYVVCWQVIDKTIKIVEIFYVGTHENAPY